MLTGGFTGPGKIHNEVIDNVFGENGVTEDLDTIDIIRNSNGSNIAADLHTIEMTENTTNETDNDVEGNLVSIPCYFPF